MSEKISALSPASIFPRTKDPESFIAIPPAANLEQALGSVFGDNPVHYDPVNEGILIAEARVAVKVK